MILGEKIIQDCFHLQIPEQPTFRKELSKPRERIYQKYLYFYFTPRTYTP